MVPTLLGSGILVFFLMRVLPGDICLVRWVDYGTNLDPALLELCRNQLGLNDPLLSQFLEFIGGVLTFKNSSLKKITFAINSIATCHSFGTSLLS